MKDKTCISCGGVAKGAVLIVDTTTPENRKAEKAQGYALCFECLKKVEYFVNDICDPGAKALADTPPNAFDDNQVVIEWVEA